MFSVSVALNEKNGRNLAAPCGLYCGVCVDFLKHESCHGCSCICGSCASLEHRENCDIHRCCVEEKGFDTCKECDELPCSKLIQFCYSPIWLHHMPAIENLKRQKAIGTKKWLSEQQEIWRNKWYLERWLWLQKECEGRLRRFKEENQKT